MSDFPSLKGKQLLAVLLREPLGYRIVRQRGSHRALRSDQHPPVTFSFHDSQTLPPRVVRKVLCKDVDLEPEEALRLL